MNAVVSVGPDIRFGGLLCKTKEEAIESAAVVALKSLVSVECRVRSDYFT